MSHNFVSGLRYSLCHFLGTRNLDLKSFPYQFMYKIDKDNSTWLLMWWITSLNSGASTILTGKSLTPIMTAISCSAFSCFSSVQVWDLPLNYFLINIHLNIYLPNNNLLSLLCCSEKIQKMKLHWYPGPEPQQLRFSAQYLPTPTSSLAELRPELKKRQS